MDTDDTRSLVLALLCVLAIALAAATLNSAVTTGGGGLGFGGGSDDPGFEEDDPSSRETRQPGAGGSRLEFPCYPVLNTPPAILAILGVIALLAFLAYRRVGVLGVFGVIGPLGIPVLLLHALLTACTGSPLSRAGNGSFSPINGSLPSGAFGSGGETSMTAPSLLLFLVLGVALVGAVALLFRSSSGSDADEPAVEELVEEDDIAAVGRAAGEAADRIESAASVENEVYRAWREMTGHLAVPEPESSTPGEFAAAAVDAGMARDDVAELTTLFEEVRYGGEDPTGEREDRAVSALRRIERTYAEDDR